MRTTCSGLRRTSAGSSATAYIVYGPLINGCTTILYEGKPVRTPDAGAFWRVIARSPREEFLRRADRVSCDQEGRSGLPSEVRATTFRRLEYLFVAGERLDPPTYHWLNDMLPIPVIDHWWQTETGWPMCANMAGIELMETKPGSPTLPVPGYDLRILDDDGEPVGPNVEGKVVLRGRCRPARCRPCGAITRGTSNRTGRGFPASI